MKTRLLALGMTVSLMLTACQPQTLTVVPKQQLQEQTLSWIHHFDEEGARRGHSYLLNNILLMHLR